MCSVRPPNVTGEQITMARTTEEKFARENQLRFPGGGRRTSDGRNRLGARRSSGREPFLSRLALLLADIARNIKRRYAKLGWLSDREARGRSQSLPYRCNSVRLKTALKRDHALLTSHRRLMSYSGIEPGRIKHA